jgi:hypothetical protein
MLSVALIHLTTQMIFGKGYTVIKPVDMYFDRICGLVFRVPGDSSRGPGFDSRPYQIFWEVRGLERGPLSLVITTEELLEKEVAAPV